ncbi:sarcolemmal membrane-associated protein-like isoform X2 [Hydractinia symbiolongicarpus]|uniref:sarcolemmal membrane-associated protein-like isoform X2 n=1 Tax=Hydractinia symbiolongicarpus TaxID=13093 RepID=UPI00254FD65B|nr:sarcolemmal membrane-associated protein-like isoform X2 [Hydractinia symbiolongicarpus]
MAFALLAPRPNSHPFQERQLSLKEPIKIGRAVAKAKSSQTNGIFDCKVLSRNHAVMWYEKGKFMLQDTKSSNGTYVNSVRLSRGSEESEPCEIKSGDILQFGVEVVENSKNVTHGCIVGLVTLFHEDGSEATGSHDESQQGLLSLLTADKNIQPHELWQLSQFLQDALHREQMLENKLATLQRMISNSHAASEDTFQGFIQEDKLLSRLETLENQLELFSKEITEEDLQAELVSYQDERLHYESAAKETLQNILKEKVEALQKCSELERLLSNTEDECSHLRSVYEKSQEELHDLMENHRLRMDEMQKLKDEMEATNHRHEAVCEKNKSDYDAIKSQLEDAEQRGSAMAVEVESLQAECDFTKKQIEAMKERLQQQQKAVDDDSLETEETEDSEPSTPDLPFASEHATLEKDVKNKTEYIKTLKLQLAEVQSELQRERRETRALKDKMESVASQTESKPIVSVHDSSKKLKDLSKEIEIAQEFQALLLETKEYIFKICKPDKQQNLLSTSWTKHTDFDAILTSPDNVDQYNSCLESLYANKNLLELINGDLQDILNYTKDENEKFKQRTQEVEERNITDELAGAYSELEEVKNQIMILGERLMEEQETNKRTKELAASLELKLLQQDWKNRLLIQSTEEMKDQLYEAHKHMNIEKLDKSMSYESLESARKLANEMQKQASDYAKVAGQEKVEIENLAEENETLKMKVSRLESECKKLQQENALINHMESTVSRLRKISPKKPIRAAQQNLHKEFDEVSDQYMDDNLQDQLDSANQSIEELLYQNQEEQYKHVQQQGKLVNVVLTLFILFVAFGALVMLDIIKVTPGSLPVLDEHTWTDIWEFLF